VTDSDTDPPADDFERELASHGLRSGADVGQEGDHGSDQEGKWGWTPGRIVASVLLLVVAGFWVWAFSPFAPNEHPDELDDPAFAEAARPLCEAASDALDALPKAHLIDTALERADLIDEGTTIYRDLVAQLRETAPDPSTPDGDVVHRWLDDYEIYLSDRDRYAAKFRAGVDEAFEVTVKGEGQITDPIDAFTIGNRIADCATPQDV
jgi:hypothetical protein